MKQNKFWLKLVGAALLVHVILIVISIIEVAIYSYVVEPGKDQAFYEAHANKSGPWVSAIFGSLLMFLFVRRFLKRYDQQQLTYAIGLPALYMVIDLLLIFASGYQIKDFVYEFLWSALIKIAAVILAYFLYRSKASNETISS